MSLRYLVSENNKKRKSLRWGLVVGGDERIEMIAGMYVCLPSFHHHIGLD